MDLQDFVFAVELGEADPPVDKALHDVITALCHTVVYRLVHDAVAGHAVAFHIFFRRADAWYGNDVQRVHATGDAARILHIALFQDQNIQFGMNGLRPNSCHGPCTTAAYDEDVGIKNRIFSFHRSSFY